MLRYPTISLTAAAAAPTPVQNFDEHGNQLTFDEDGNELILIIDSSSDEEEDEMWL